MTDLPNLVGGALCLDFVNTVDARHAPGRREYLDSYPALLAWSRRAGIIDAARDERLREADSALHALGKLAHDTRAHLVQADHFKKLLVALFPFLGW